MLTGLVDIQGQGWTIARDVPSEKEGRMALKMLAVDGASILLAKGESF